MRNPFAVCLSVLIALAVTTQPVLAGSGSGVATSSRADWLEAGRAVIAGQLVEAGRGPDAARAAAAALTADDLAVLLANPAMMQPAGQTMSSSLIIALIMIAVLIAIGSSSNGFVSVNS